MLKHSYAFQNMLNVVVFLILTVGSAAFPSSAFADSVIIVTTNADTISADGLCSLREAIINANNDSQTYDDCVGGSGNDTIQFDDTLSSTIPIVLVDSSLPNISDPEGLTINGGGDISISGGSLYRIFIVDSGVPFTLDSISALNGECSGCLGGTIYALSGALLTVINSVISNSGQAIYNDSGTLTITSSTFTDNSAIYGGSIENHGTLIVTNSTFSGNSSASGGGSAVYTDGTATITKSTFSNNISTGNARGSFYNGGTATISNSTFFGNITTGTGCCNGAGAVYNQGAMTVINSTFSGNGTMTTGGGADIYQLGATSTLHLYNNILANSTNEQNCRLDFNSGTVDGNNNLIQSEVDCITTSPLSDDPQLGAVTGSPAYLPLNPGSPAIDAGDDSVCADTPVNNTSQNGLSRLQGTHCDIGAFEAPSILSLALTSLAANDGWILESTETSGKGGTMNSSATTFNLGDDLANKQYRAILHFDTSSLPDTAVITSAILKIKKQGQSGSNPFTILGGLKMDMCKPSFGTAALTLSDFKSAAGKSKVATFGSSPVNKWYSAALNNTGKLYINRTGTTQFRLYFTKDDNNNNSNNFMKFYSGNTSVANRPQLIIEYYVP